MIRYAFNKMLLRFKHRYNYDVGYQQNCLLDHCLPRGYARSSGMIVGRVRNWWSTWRWRQNWSRGLCGR